ncbi:MAG: fused MFS/spermidine synthase [Fibrobacteria bacterium]|nr:fused MFS/spermidine synthase [Fibrobacteria bacterium]
MKLSLYLRILVFFVGMVTLGAELSASRLLAPYFGTSMPVWSALIGLILLALSLGYYLGGKLADHSPRLKTLMHVVTSAGICLALLTFVGRPILVMSLAGFAKMDAGILIGSFISTLLLLGLPMVLLGCATPFAVRLATEDISHAGTTSGNLFAFSTMGSFIGSLLPALVLIPWIGTRSTFIFFGLLLIVICLPGYLMEKSFKNTGISVILLILIAGYGVYMTGQPIKPGKDVLFEGESIYQYVQVIEKKNGHRLLKLNEGLVSHSTYHPKKLLTFREWDYFALAPYFNSYPYNPMKQAKSWALIGSGAGTSARLITQLYGPVRIKGVELDPLILEVGSKYFDMDSPNFEAVAQDGRAWITLDKGRYDVIGVDAYRQPYIPFELATVEFFQLVRDHLTPSGVIGINAPQPLGNRSIVNALATTLSEVFPCVYLLTLRSKSQTILIVGTKAPSTKEDFFKNTIGLSGNMHRLASAARPLVEKFESGGMILTDDKAPVERLMDLVILQTILKGTQSIKKGS